MNTFATKRSKFTSNPPLFCVHFDTLADISLALSNDKRYDKADIKFSLIEGINWIVSLCFDRQKNHTLNVIALFGSGMLVGLLLFN